MKVLLANPRGFCAGVDRAISIVERALDIFQPPIYADDYSDQLDDVDSDGCVPVPSGPGLGVTYDWDKINRWEIAREVYE